MTYKKLLVSKENKLYIDTTTLILFTFLTVFYSRIFCTITHAPSALNFFHFVVAMLTFGVAITTSRTKDKEQVSIAQNY
jgi:hypothetical protein